MELLVPSCATSTGPLKNVGMESVPRIASPFAFGGQAVSDSFGMRANSVKPMHLNLSEKKNRLMKNLKVQCSQSVETGGPTGLNRPVVILPGLGNNTSDYNQLSSDLNSLGLSVKVAQVSRPDWLRNASGLLTADYYKGTLKPLPILKWYLERVEKAIEEAKKDNPNTKISLIGHSAGGWLARLYMFEKGFDDVSLLLSLGTPHLPPPRGVSGVIDQTRGLLYYIQENFPGAYHQPHVKYVCVAGRYLKGNPLFGKAPNLEAAGVGPILVDNLKSEFNANTNLNLSESLDAISATNLEAATEANENPVTFRSRIVGQGYKQVCGQAEVWGDGVVPEVSAFLEGAHNISLEGVHHSPVGANDHDRPWYGTKGVLDKWVHHLFD